jgi:hypothetical protein
VCNWDRAAVFRAFHRTGFVDAVFYLLELRDLAATLRLQRAVTTGALAAAVTLLSVTLAVGQDSLKGKRHGFRLFGCKIFFFTFSFTNSNPSARAYEFKNLF